MSIIEKLKRKYIEYKGGERYINYLREKGIRIGEDCHIGDAKTIKIDLTRPYLVEIGDNVRMNTGLTILTHDFSSSVLQNLYADFIPSSGKVKIGNNVYFAQKCTVLKGVTIGNNCIIGYGSLVTKDIPDNSVAAGVPAKVICTIEEYYKKRKEKSIIESFKLVEEFEKAYGRAPKIEEFREEYFLFISGSEADKYQNIPLKRKLSTKKGLFERWQKEHKAPFKSYEEFIEAAHIFNSKQEITTEHKP